MLAQLASVEEVIRIIKDKSETYAHYQKLFDVPTAEWQHLSALQKIYKTRKDIWQTLHNWQEKKRYWGTEDITKLDVEIMRNEVPPPPPSAPAKTRSGPQRVRMSSGERPIGAAKGKQFNTEALCRTPPGTCPSPSGGFLPQSAHVRAPGSTHRHTPSAFMAHPPPRPRDTEALCPPPPRAVL